MDYAKYGPIVVFVIIALSVLVIGALILRERRRIQAVERYKNHQCASCGYDLRASDDRCPECGSPIYPPEMPITTPLDPRALRTQWPSETIQPRTPQSEEGLVDLYNSSTIQAVDMLIDQLQARGIPTSARISTFVSPSRYYSGSTDSQYKTVSVWSNDLDRAVAIVRSFTLAERDYQKRIHTENPQKPP